MLHWSKPNNETKLSLGSRIPVSQTKRSRSFRMNDNRKQKSTSSDFTARNVYHTSRALEIVDSEKGNMSPKFELEPQRNIEADVFDWLSKNSETSDKYTAYYLENNTSVCANTAELHSITNGETASKNNEETLGITPERDTEMAKDKTGTKSYFNAFKNAIFPFEGKYFYLSGELNNQKVSLTETTKTIGDNSAHLMEKTKIIGDNAGRLMDKTNCDDDRYKEILGDRKGDNATKTTNKKWEINGLKDTKVYHEDQRMNTEDKNGYVRCQYGCNKDNMTPLKINLKSDTYSESQQKEINRLRTQIEKLSTFVESSDERREQSEARLAQQNEELLKHIRQNKVLDNRVCCLDELRRNLQRKVDEISEEDKSLKLALKSSEEKLIEEKEKVQVLKQECSSENAKNVELELVLQTIREELGCPSPANNQKSSDLFLGTRKSHDDLGRDWAEGLNETESNLSARHVEKKVRWGDVQTQEIKKPTQSAHFNAEQQLWGPSTSSPQPEAETARPPQYSCLKQHPSEEALWKREKKQFEGKIMLLEMDKKKLRSEMDLLEATIIKEETTAQTLRENNEVLEFRILELEYELLEKAKKQ
ncbi:Hypothetical predicted protein [Paramuricea clavata]|uniref:Uncharacterized protein n=2 Tax=Paramuricea clavata TaxID=317549 RepID=A0A6S7JWB2_PARCT|nr:Hypothetical predicted protein [Paramuricea clavata]